MTFTFEGTDAALVDYQDCAGIPRESLYRALSLNGKLLSQNPFPIA